MILEECLVYNEVEHNVFFNIIFIIAIDFKHNDLQNKMRTHSTVTKKNPAHAIPSKLRFSHAIPNTVYKFILDDST